MRLLLAIWATKILTIIGKLGGKKGTSTPGKIALKICPDLIRILSGNVKKDIIAVCGTNGKTTTNNLLREALTYNGYKVICNSAGANMPGGIATVFAQACDIFGRFAADYACIEVDEAFANKVFDHLKPTYMIITNLFRDQLDRYGEIDITTGLLKKAVDKAGNICLILNGDDPLTAQFGFGRRNAFYFGVLEKVLPQNAETREGRFCVICGGEMKYNYFHYSQLGDFYCPSCGYERPPINYAAYDVDIQNTLEFSVGNSRLCLRYKGFYNIYNVLAVYAVLSVLKVKADKFNDVLSVYKPQIGRMEEFMLNKPVILNLSKNPAGFNQAIMTVQKDTRKKDVIVAINDNHADGLDVSWLWDVDFDRLGDDNLNHLAVTGTRLYDIALRFKYAEVKFDEITENMKQSIINCLSTDSEVCYVLVNYTALFSTQSILSELMKSYRNGALHG